VRESQINCAVLSCVRPDFHTTSATPLVPTVRNAAQIANKIAALFKTEFFNSIGQNRTVNNQIIDIVIRSKRPEEPIVDGQSLD